MSTTAKYAKRGTIVAHTFFDSRVEQMALAYNFARSTLERRPAQAHFARMQLINDIGRSFSDLSETERAELLSRLHTAGTSIPETKRVLAVKTGSLDVGGIVPKDGAHLREHVQTMLGILPTVDEYVVTHAPDAYAGMTP